VQAIQQWKIVRQDIMAGEISRAPELLQSLMYPIRSEDVALATVEVRDDDAMELGRTADKAVALGVEEITRPVAARRRGHYEGFCKISKE
jgi:hypothetical protein